MNNREQGSSEFCKKAKKETKKRAWSSEEEQVLIDGLRALVASGWKTDNGFKANYMSHLEDAMRVAFPGTDITAKPHIESKLTACKRTYAQLRDILSRSGVGFNLKGDNRIDCENQVWEEICRSDPSIPQKWRNKSWPFWEHWKVVFGKDRATGEGGAEFMEMVNDLLNNVEAPSQGKKEDPIDVEASQPRAGAAVEDSVGQSTFETAKPSKSLKRKHFDDNMSSLVELVGEIQQTNAAKFEVFTSAFGQQAQLNKARANMWPLLKQIPGMSRNEMFAAAEKLMKLPECLQLFIGLPEEDRAAYIDRVMDM